MNSLLVLYQLLNDCQDTLNILSPTLGPEFILG